MMLKKIFGKIIEKITHNLGYKVLAVVFGFLIWSFVVAQANPVRTVWFRDLTITVAGRETLADNGLRMSRDLEIKARVRVGIKRSERHLLKPDSIVVTADIAGITSEGKHRVTLKAEPRYGERGSVRILPDSVEIEVEKSLQRDFVINVVRRGTETEDLYTAEAKPQPETVKITGPLRQVAKISQAVIETDQPAKPGDASGTYPIILLDAEGNVLEDSTLSLSHASAMLERAAYPVREIPLLPAGAALVGAPAPGYQLDKAWYLPDVNSVRVAAPESILDALDMISPASPVNIEGAEANIQAELEL
ncbi:MAG: CdaR family protein, partial [Clostridia bacterium]|nr:CdaR family protein [Clostridia bacterium]